jgi:signal transduction histidine kinase
MAAALRAHTVVAVAEAVTGRSEARRSSAARAWGIDALVAIGYILGCLGVLALRGWHLAWWFTGWPGHLPFAEQSAAAMVLGGGLLLMARRVAPRIVFVATFTLGALGYLLGLPTGLPIAALVLCVLYAATRFTTRGFGLLALVISIGSLAGWAVPTALGQVRSGGIGTALDVTSAAATAPAVVGFGLVVLTWAAADQVRASVERTSLAQASQVAQAQERIARAEVGALEERQRIAREMHDIVAHGLSVMIVQADGARFAAGTDPDAATRALATIAETGRTSLAEMRRLLGLLRDGEEPAANAPAPRLADLDDLVDQIRTAGVPVTYSVTGAQIPVDEVVQLTAYRIVQEALTNVLKHAGPGVRVSVVVSADPDRVSVDVVDDGVGGAPTHTGLGLQGMAERAAMLGGHAEAGPGRSGGFHVHASLPIGGVT